MSIDWETLDIEDGLLETTVLRCIPVNAYDGEGTSSVASETGTEMLVGLEKFDTGETIMAFKTSDTVEINDFIRVLAQEV